MATPIPIRRRVDLGAHVLRAIEKAGHLQKEVYIPMGLSASQWSRALAGVPGYGLDLHKLIEAPWWFWKEFLPLLGLAVLKVFIEDIRGDHLTTETRDASDHGEDTV